MSYGLRVWDASGNLTLDVTDRLTRLVTSVTVSFTTSSNEADKYISITLIGDQFHIARSNWQPFCVRKYGIRN